ncbi:MAG: beta-N-acetylglucosaminidase [Vicingaceae bacterium]|nr:MAG: beta-N-acetylglucosaminidase [Vicingaceae bacterium]
MKKVKISTVLAIILIFSLSNGKTNYPISLEPSTPIADSIIKHMPLKKQIAQLFMVAAYSNKDEKHVKEIEKLITEYNIGGLIFFQGTPEKQFQLTKMYQSKSSIPLMIGIDAEWGLAMRLDNTPKYPWQMVLGALENDSLIYQMGLQIAHQCRALGIHINFAPVVDLNNNPDNPVINARSFGENKYAVAKKSLMYMKGLMDGGVLACAKHFPGHGNTHTDSHLDLPVIDVNRQQINEYELYPFQFLMNFDLPSVMVAHIALPSITGDNSLPATLSPLIVKNILQDSLGFKGLIFTDALNMKGVSKFYKPGQLEVKALLAGNDILLFSENIPVAIDSIMQAVNSGLIDSAEIARKCHKVLKFKERYNIFQNPAPKNFNPQELNKTEYRALINKIIRESITVAKNVKNTLPISDFNQKIAWISTGIDESSTFYNTLKYYTRVDSLSIQWSADSLIKAAGEYDLIIISHHISSKTPWKKYQLSDEIRKKLQLISLKNNVVLVGFCNPYFLKSFASLSNFESIVIAYLNDKEAQFYTAQILFGARDAKGRLPVTAHPKLLAGTGYELTATDILQYLTEDEMKLNQTYIFKIDSFVNRCISEKVFPGCQILAAKNGKVFFMKNYGNLTYDPQSPKVTDFTLYDVASVTKITATLPLIMRIDQRHEFNTDHYLGQYLPKLTAHTPYFKVNLKEMLAHQAGLPAWIPFYLDFIRNSQLDPEYFSQDSTTKFSVKVKDSLYTTEKMEKYIYDKILSTPLKKKEYRYSDIGYYFLKKIIEEKYDLSLDIAACRYFYAPLGMSETMFNPWKKIPPYRVAPSEYDTYFRQGIIHRYVHDPGSAMLGGIGGHAGLFSNANDMAKIMQMYLQWGKYGQQRLLDSAVIAKYTECAFCNNENGNVNRRGLGFDKPVRDGSNGPTFNGISFESYGHTGFTGTMVWADPETGIVYVFLSNRTYPSSENNKIVQLNVRSTIQQWIYEMVK